jgi:hypothetical protein
MESLESHLNMYLSELSRVFFKKENLRSKSWWLSAFYSFCIQSMVRRGLMELTDETSWQPQASAARQYLHLAVRLFVATSGTYDPLTKKYSPDDTDSLLRKKGDKKASDQDFKVAQITVKQDCWEASGVTGSVQYLQELFQDNGGFLIGKSIMANDVDRGQRHSSSGGPFSWLRDRLRGSTRPDIEA